MLYAAMALVALIVLLVVVIALRPAEFCVSRSTTMSAPAEIVFAQVNDFRKWEAWSPWAKLDLNCKNTYEGAPAGKDAGMHWSGNKKVGEGRMTIMESYPHQKIVIRLEFVRPFACINTSEFVFQPGGASTQVTWSMFGRNGFMAKAFGLFLNMDRMVGHDFDKGLRQIKSIVESRRY